MPNTVVDVVAEASHSNSMQASSYTSGNPSWKASLDDSIVTTVTEMVASLRRRVMPTSPAVPDDTVQASEVGIWQPPIAVPGTIGAVWPTVSAFAG